MDRRERHNHGRWYVSELPKRRLIRLPGMARFHDLTKAQLSRLAVEVLRRAGINRRGTTEAAWQNLIRPNVDALMPDDDEFLVEMRQANIARQQANQQRREQRFNRDTRRQAAERAERNALDEVIEEFMNMGQVYDPKKTPERIRWEEIEAQITNRKQYDEYFKKYREMMRKRVSFGIDIADDLESRFAFEQAVKHSRMWFANQNSKPMLSAQDLAGNIREFTLWDNRNMGKVWKVLDGLVDIEEEGVSDPRYNLTGAFIPVRFAIRFHEYDKKNKKLRRVNWQDNAVEEEEFDMSLWDLPAGEFFPYINNSGLDLTVFQIFDKIPKSYQDTCFVYACIQSGLFTKVEIESLRLMCATRKLPQKYIPEIAVALNCHFKIKKIYEDQPVKSQMRIHVDTTRLTNQSFRDIPTDRLVTMFLYKGHYFIDKSLPFTLYYAEHKQQLDKDYADMPIEKRMQIARISQGKPRYSDKGTKPMEVLRLLFKLNQFREITSQEHDLLKTSEFKHGLTDFIDLDYAPKLCTRAIERGSNLHHYSRVYYADFETDPTVSPHQPYLCCVVSPLITGKITKQTFTGDNIDQHLLDYLQDGSLTYFHNLRYDACFFTNNATGYDVKILERSGTVLSIQMTKKQGNKITKQLTFHNSYSIISAPLKQFKSMFGLNVAKEKMAYKLYTKANRDRKTIPITEFYEQYDIENWMKTDEKLEKAHKQIKQNAIAAHAFENDEIDIMKYAEFYCVKDCIVLMQGMEKFKQQLNEVFKEAGTSVPDLHNFVSISAIGYAFCKAYGCLDGCYEIAGKPQSFMLRCVSGGRTMTANNEKQIIGGKLQDFDAVSLYPSAMSIMPGIPKGIPKVITDKSDIMKYDAFFCEIIIHKLECKSPTPYKFGLVFKRDENTGSKLFCNEAVGKFYIDKRGLQDLMEFYDIEYEVIRGYYFDEGFNNKLSGFITKLFNLRLRYKKEKNPLQNTIKLLLNSIYGKSILKPTPTENKCVSKNQLDKFIIRNYYWIEEINTSPNIEKAFCKVIKPIDRHFNCPQFGVSVLSWSKHIMNRVMCTAEQNGIHIFYQDTDSMHLLEADVPELAAIYKEKYGQDLIGSNLTQFHCDFDTWKGAVGDVHSVKLIALGKKSYLDILEDEKGNRSTHVRLKGIPHNVMNVWCRKNGKTLEDLYNTLYEGNAVTFNILDGSNGFRKNKYFQQVNLESFERRVLFK